MNVRNFIDAIATLMREHESWAAPIAFLVAFGNHSALPRSSGRVGLSWSVFPAPSPRAASAPTCSTPHGDRRWPRRCRRLCAVVLDRRLLQGSIPSIWPFKSDPTLIPRGEQFFQKYGPGASSLDISSGRCVPSFPWLPACSACRNCRSRSPIPRAPSSGRPGPSGAVLGIYYKDAIFTFILGHQDFAAARHVPALGTARGPHSDPVLADRAAAAGRQLPLPRRRRQRAAAAGSGSGGVFAGDMVGYLIGRARKEDPHAVWPFSWYPDGLPPARDYLGQARRLSRLC